MVTKTKPSWDDAPSWAKWLAMDYGGEWWWYEEMPVMRYRHGIWDEFGRRELALFIEPEHTLEMRPKLVKHNLY